MYEALGEMLPENTTIAAGKQYVFVFNSGRPFGIGLGTSAEMTAKLNAAMNGIASNISAIVDGSKITVTFIPQYVMDMANWRISFYSAFSAMGFGASLTDFYVGQVSKEESFHPIDNITTFYKPMIQSAGNFLGSVGSGLKKILYIGGGIGILTLFGYAYFKGRGQRPTYAKNQPIVRKRRKKV